LSLSLSCAEENVDDKPITSRAKNGATARMWASRTPGIETKKQKK
jgi:hypothetical protein